MNETVLASKNVNNRLLRSAYGSALKKATESEVLRMASALLAKQLLNQGSHTVALRIRWRKHDALQFSICEVLADVERVVDHGQQGILPLTMAASKELWQRVAWWRRVALPAWVSRAFPW